MTGVLKPSVGTEMVLG